MSGPDPHILARQLAHLGHATRLRLLTLLAQPKTIGELELPPGPGRGAERPDRPIARQSVLEHLHKLEEIGLVRSQPAEGGRSTQLEYVAVRARLFALIEEMREVLDAQPPTPAGALETVTTASWGAPSTSPGPRLVLVHGAGVGRVFPLLRSALVGERGWILGRKDPCHVLLDYDPFVSSENAEIVEKDGRYHLVDLRVARNGTWVNWARLPLGGSVPISSGDVIGVGRSLLVFRA